ncbi:hypothetical protein CMUS01_11193 [Colletotrichum musicola]|uniref:Uncharacterized protein n=1 Tax=Colletotrichum musicola TaxID=2175873 RepID=A0A8H6JZ62_9PEZI|nr:hypothetical protein CMUS01_11193 [Colletotrichum musicola]
MPVIDARFLQEGAVEVGTMLMKRSVDHTVLETLAVGTLGQHRDASYQQHADSDGTAATCVFGVGGFIYWINKK